MKLPHLLLAGLLVAPIYSPAKDKDKDKEIALAETPAAVQATIKKTTDAGATLEKVEVEQESGGTQYGAKIVDKNGQRWEIIMDAAGNVVKTQQKKPKK